MFLEIQLFKDIPQVIHDKYISIYFIVYTTIVRAVGKLNYFSFVGITLKSVYVTRQFQNESQPSFWRWTLSVKSRKITHNYFQFQRNKKTFTIKFKAHFFRVVQIFCWKCTEKDFDIKNRKIKIPKKIEHLHRKEKKKGPFHLFFEQLNIWGSQPSL